jgi:hypothetical protein
LTPTLLYYSISGMTEPMSIFLMALAVLLASSGVLKNKTGDWLSGVALGLFYLARYNALVFIPFFLLFRWLFRKEGLLPPARMLACFILTALPWFIRNTALFGSPLFSLQKYEPVMFTPAYPDYSLYLFPIKVNVIDFFKTHPESIIEKISSNWTDYLSSFFNPELNGISAVIMIIFLAAVLLPLTQKAAGIKPLLVLCYLTQLAALLVIHFIPRLFLVFSPFYIIFALGALYTLLNLLCTRFRSKTAPGLVTAAAILLLSYNNYTNSGPPKKYTPERPIYSDILYEIKAKVPENKVALTDLGHQVSWYGGNYACKIPYSVDMIPEIQKRTDVGALFISDRILWHMPEADRSWKEFWYQKPKELHGMKLYKVYEKGLLYLP